jgi:Domain of unknown function (DUF4424)
MLVRRALVLAFLAFALALPVLAHAADITVEVGAGGLAFAGNPSIRIDSQDILVTPEKITVTYALRNSASSPQSIFISFALPDLDANLISEDNTGVVDAVPENFVGAKTIVDGQPAVLKAEQHTIALGLNATAALQAAGLPLFPLGEGLTAKLEALSAAQRIDLLERGILKEDGAAVAPAWTLKTVAYWRQSFAAGQTITIVHSYQPLAGAVAYSSEAVSPLRKKMCLTQAQESAIAKLASNAGTALRLKTIAYNAPPGSDSLGPVTNFRLIIETGDPQTVVATCREGLKRTGPMQLEWSAADHTPDDDFLLLFAR